MRIWPLEMHLARALPADRLVLVGDAAHLVHPIAGQGLNLGLRDVAALTEVVTDAARLGLDIGSAIVLARYERWRRTDAALSAAAFDGLNRLFSSDWTLLRTARSAGLGAGRPACRCSSSSSWPRPPASPARCRSCCAASGCRSGRRRGTGSRPRRFDNVASYEIIGYGKI